MDLNKTKILEIASGLLKRAGFEVEVKIAENSFLNPELPDEKSFFVVSIESEKDISVLIGKNGQNLNALDHLIRLVAMRKLSEEAQSASPHFIVDVNDYRKLKANYLIETARNTAKRVIQTQRAEALLPMNAYERRLIHTELAVFKEVQTESIGQEPCRRVVIKPQPDIN